MAEQENSDLIDEIGDVLAGMHVSKKAINAVTNGLGKGGTNARRLTGGGASPGYSDGQMMSGVPLSDMSPGDASSGSTPAEDAFPAEGGAFSDDDRRALHKALAVIGDDGTSSSHGGRKSHEHLLDINDHSGKAHDIPSMTTHDDKVGDIDVHTASLKIDSADVEIVSLHHGKSEVEIIDVDAGDKHFEVLDIKDGKKEKVFVIDSDDDDEDDDGRGDDGQDDQGYPDQSDGDGGHGDQESDAEEPGDQGQLDEVGGGYPGSGRMWEQQPPARTGRATQAPLITPANGAVQGTPAVSGAPADEAGQPGDGSDGLSQKLVEPGDRAGAAVAAPSSSGGQHDDGQSNGGEHHDGDGTDHDGDGDGRSGGDGQSDSGGTGRPDDGKTGKEHVETPQERQRNAANQGNDDPANGKITKIDGAYLNLIQAKHKTLADTVHNSTARQLLVGFVGNGTPYSESTRGASNSPPSSQAGEPSASSGNADTKLLAGNTKWAPAQAFKTAFDATALDVVNQMNWFYGFLERMSDDIKWQAQNFSDAEEHNGMTAQDLAGIFSNMPEIGDSSIPGASDAVGLLQDIILNGQT